MFRLLIIEDQDDFFENYLLRLFGLLLPMEGIAFERAATLPEAGQRLLENRWDLILMDYTIGPRVEFLGDLLRNGADLTRLRRGVEVERHWNRAFVAGTASSGVGNRAIFEAGAQKIYLKSEVEKMAELIKFRMEKE
jgi:hypothetical protein